MFNQNKPINMCLQLKGTKQTELLTSGFTKCGRNSCQRLSNYKARQPSHNLLKLTVEMYSFTSTLLENTGQNNIKQFIYNMIIQHVSLAIYHV